MHAVKVNAMCYAPGWVQGSLTYVTKSLKAGAGDRNALHRTEVLLHNRDDTRLSPHPSMVALGCLDEGDKRGDGQGCYLS
jgi:hypothetical protein